MGLGNRGFKQDAFNSIVLEATLQYQPQAYYVTLYKFQHRLVFLHSLFIDQPAFVKTNFIFLHNQTVIQKEVEWFRLFSLNSDHFLRIC